MTEDEDVPNGPNPVVLPKLREPDTHICGCCHSEVEQLTDAARLPPTQERRRPRATIGTSGDSFARDMGDHHASVGVVEIEEKYVEKARQHTYCEVLLAAENMHLHNKPINVIKAKRRPNWLKWKAAMQEELDLLE